MFTPPPLPRTLEASFRDLGSTRAETRASAVKDLARHAEDDDTVRARALPKFTAALGDASAAVRAAAALALADVRGHEAMAQLLAAIEDADPLVRQMALTAIGEIGDVRALPRLRRALADDRNEVRYQALIAFARLAEPAEAAQALVDGMRDDDRAIRYIAVRLVEDRLNGGQDDPARALPDAVEEPLRARLADEANDVRVAAAIVLAKRGHRAKGARDATGIASARALILDVVLGRVKALAAEDEGEAVELAGELGLDEARPALERRAWGLGRLLRETNAWHAKIALARMGHARARAEILRDLAGARGAALTAAVVAAGRARLAEARELLGRSARAGVDPALVADALGRLP
jgi:HEAT repeat protein